ncbi:hypothetical protein [Aureliella helgolandensis]|nr:hypothetical protein [Aureliella helgolandensis]
MNQLLLAAAACLSAVPGQVAAQEDASVVVKLTPASQQTSEDLTLHENASFRLVSSSTNNRTERVASLRTNSFGFQSDSAPPPPVVSPPVALSPTHQTEPADSEALAPMQSRKLVNAISAVNVSVHDIGTGVVPTPSSDRHAEEAVFLQDGYARGAAFQCVHWHPSEICHFPLYFEDAMLERHGHVRFSCIQPVASGAKFLTSAVMLPYLSTLQPPCQSRYALGHYRAGSCAPRLRNTVPWDCKAATVQTLSVGGLFWAAPL